MKTEGIRERFLDKRDDVRNGSALIYVFYAAIMNAMPLQGSLGKWCMTFKVVDANICPVPFWRAMLRE